MKNANDPTVMTSPEYRQFIEDLKARVISARILAARAVNRDLILLYWDIGRGIVEKQQVLGWGESVVEMVSADLQRAFPQMTGFSPRNVWAMRRLYATYTAPDFLAQAVRENDHGTPNQILRQTVAEFGGDKKRPQAAAKLPDSKVMEFLPQVVAEIPWGHHRLILDKITDPAALLYYLRATAQFGWSRNVLLNQIKAGAYERAVIEKKTHNFPLALPEHLAEQADEMMKSSYNIEFGRFWRQLPQRGCVSQPGVAAWPLPWVTINHVVNPNGIVSNAHDSRYDATPLG
jgi:predicted nuclease of restriction endonuclease-like (RecB) superfamily